MFTYGMPLPSIDLKIPAKSMEVFKQMRNYNKSSDFQQYAKSLLSLIGGKAVQNAGDYILSGGAPRPSPITLKLRELGGDRSKKALYQTGEMLKSLFSDVKGLNLEFGVRGPRAGVARIQENGFAIRVSSQMVAGFFALGQQYKSTDIIKWIASKDAAEGSEDTGGSTVIKVPPRPFLAPSLNRAVDEVLQGPELQNLDAALVDVVRAKIFGGTVEFSALTRYGATYRVQPR